MAVKRKAIEDPHLNLTSIMNLVTILIPFLIMAAQFVQLSVIDSTLPAIGPPTQVEPPKPDEKPPLQLSLALKSDGIVVLGADRIIYPDGAPEVAEGEKRPPTLPCKSGGECTNVEDYDWDGLKQNLNLIKDEYPDDENVILVPNSDTQYEIIVRAMDIAREDADAGTGDGPRTLFPFVVVAGGAM
jgi:biopolymer transport protein ExbD